MKILPGNKLELIYIDTNKRITHRVVKVTGVTEDSIKAFCYTKRQLRTFKLENILSVLPIGYKKRMGA